MKNKCCEKIKNDNNQINKINFKKFNNKRSCSSMNIFEEKKSKKNIFNDYKNNNKYELIINQNNYEPIKKEKFLIYFIKITII